MLVTGDDEDTAIRPVFSWSYRALRPEDRRAFRILGLHPGPDISLQGATALINSTKVHIRDQLMNLTDAHLLEQASPNRFRFHDLLRLYANECAVNDESNEARTAAIERNLNWYFYSAVAAMRRITPQPPRINFDVAKQSRGGEIAPIAFEDRRKAMEWCDAEHMNLIAVIKQAIEVELYDIAWNPPLVLWEFFNVRKHWSSWIYTHELGLAATERSGDELGRTRILNNLGAAYLQRRRFKEALIYLKKSLTASRKLDDQHGQAVALNNIGACIGDSGASRRPFKSCEAHSSYGLSWTRLMVLAVISLVWVQHIIFLADTWRQLIAIRGPMRYFVVLAIGDVRGSVFTTLGRHIFTCSVQPRRSTSWSKHLQSVVRHLIIIARPGHYINLVRAGLALAVEQRRWKYGSGRYQCCWISRTRR